MVAGKLKLALFAAGVTGAGEEMGDGGLEDDGLGNDITKVDNFCYNESPCLECLGGGEPSFHYSFRRLGRLYHPELCILLKTKLCGPSLHRVHRRSLDDWGFYVIDSHGLSGGIIVAWDQGQLKLRFSSLLLTDGSWCF